MTEGVGLTYGSGMARPGRPSRPMTFVMIPDRMIRAVISDALTEAQFRVMSFPDAAELRQAILRTRHLPAAVVFDGESGGFSFNALPPGTGLVILAGSVDPGESLRTNHAQTTVLRKPFTPRDLVDAVRKLCYKAD